MSKICWNDAGAAKVRERAWRDPFYREELLRSPRTAVSVETGMTIPEEINLQVREEQPNQILLRLPWEMDEEDLTSAEGQIARRAAEEPAFRKLLLENPRSALQAELGISLPETVAVQVLEETYDLRYLVLPVQPVESYAPIELPDAALMSVVGGGRTYLPVVIKCTSGASGYADSQSDCEMRGGEWSSPWWAADAANTGTCNLTGTRRSRRRAC